MTRVIAAALGVFVLAACADGGASRSPSPSGAPSTSAVPASSFAASSRGASPLASAAPEPPDGRLVAAGDIAACDSEHDSLTGALIESLGDDVTVATLGDNVYPSGTGATFADCYHPAWGAFLDRTRPALGNHDVEADGGAAYHAYFGDRAGGAGDGWYSYDIGEWHAVVLNSNCELIPCGVGSAQHDWLVADLAASDAVCTLAYQHHPRFSSGMHGDYPPVAPLWEALQDAGADVLLVGHDHNYERLAPQTPSGEPSPEGIRQFTVGTGGSELRPAFRTTPNSELIVDDAFGVLELTLHAGSYDWRFLTIDGVEADAGTGPCH